MKRKGAKIRKERKVRGENLSHSAAFASLCDFALKGGGCSLSRTVDASIGLASLFSVREFGQSRFEMQRFHQILLIASLLALSWLLMQAVHEIGHVIVAWATGGAVTKVVLHPLAISRTDVEPNPRPLMVAWGGPAIGILVPLAMWGVANGVRLSMAFLFRFFASFCLVANGLYLGVGSFNAIGDAGDILRHGGSQWSLIVFGVAAVPAGFALWNGQAPNFGVGARQVSPLLAWSCTCVLAAIILLELVFCNP